MILLMVVCQIYFYSILLSYSFCHWYAFRQWFIHICPDNNWLFQNHCLILLWGINVDLGSCYYELVVLEGGNVRVRIWSFCLTRDNEFSSLCVCHNPIKSYQSESLCLQIVCLTYSYHIQSQIHCRILISSRQIGF